MCNEKSEICETFELIDSQKDYDPNLRKKLILFVGVTGSGKSTLAHFITGNKNLKSITNSGLEYYVTDGNKKVSVATTVSKTLFPELILDPESGNVLADCPGFSDTRDASHDIAATIFTRNLVNNAEQAKIVVVASHHSVRKGLDRLAFPNVINHVAEFVTDIKKYSSSIALMVTKVENTSEFDDLIIEEIGTFLKEEKTVLESEPQNNLTDKKIELMKIFLQQKNGLYSNIGIFRRPDMVGPLDELENLKDGKTRNREILFNQLQYTETDPADFGLTVSVRSKLTVLRMIENSNQNIAKLVDDVCKILGRTYDAKIGNSKTIDELQTTISDLSEMINQIELGNSPQFNVIDTVKWFTASSTEENKSFGSNMLEQQRYLDFLKPLFTVEKNKKLLNDFSKYYPKLATFKQILGIKKSSAADKMLKIIDEKIQDLINDASVELNETYDSKIAASDKIEELHPIFSSISKIIDQIKQTNKNEIRILDVINWFDASKILIPEDLQKGLLEQKSKLDFIEKILENDSSRNNINNFIPYYKIVTIERAFEQINSKVIDKMSIVFNGKIKQTFNNISNRMIEKFSQEVSKSTNYLELEKQLKQAFEIVSKFNTELSYLSETSNVEELVKDLLKKVFSTVSFEQAQELSTHSNELKLIKEAATSTTTYANQKRFPETLKTAEEHLGDLSRWYTFINHCFAKLSSYNNRKNLDTNVENIQTFVEFKRFLDSKRISYDDKLVFNTTKQKSLDNLIKKTLTSSTVECCKEPNKVVVKGNFVKLSDIECEEACINNASLYIFAYHTLFIDADLIKEGQERSVYIMAPIWDVRQKIKFNLNGKNGQPHLQSSANLEAHGMPGNSGGHAGNFIGAGIEFINSDDLTITANGGAGGNGQNGGDGKAGSDGQTPSEPGDSKWHRNGSSDTCRSQTDRKDINGISQDGGDFILYGKDGTAGTDAGNGGKAGIGGNNGEIQVFSIGGQPNHIQIFKRVELNGEYGRGGKGGKGGENGKNLHISCYEVTKFWESRYALHYRTPIYRLTGKKNDGSTGIDNYSEIALQKSAITNSESLRSLSNVYQSANEIQNNFFDPITFKNFPKDYNREKRSTYHTADPLKNSAFTTPSLMLKGFFECINEHTKNIMRQLVPNNAGTKNLNMQLEQGSSSNGSFGPTVAPSVDAFNSLILLLDVIARKLTKAKPSSKIGNGQTGIHWLEAQGAALNIVEKCEASWINLHRINITDDNGFDFLALQRSVLKKVLQQDGLEGLGQVEKNALEMVDAHYLQTQQYMDGDKTRFTKHFKSALEDLHNNYQLQV